MHRKKNWLFFSLLTERVLAFVAQSEEEKAAKERAREKKKRAEIEKKNLVELQKIRDENFNKRQNQYDLEIRALRIAGKETIEIEKAKILASIEYQKQKARARNIKANKMRET